MNSEQQSILQLIEHLGYYLLPKSRPDSLGHTGLVVAIRAHPTGKHFDPERLRVRLVDGGKTCDWHLVSWMSPLDEGVRVCPGLVSLTDRNRKRVDFFSYGGWLESAPGPNEMVYSLRSAAPLLRITEDEETIADQLAAESEALLAEIEARWLPSDAGFHRLLAQVDPLQVYVSTLCSIMASYEQREGRRVAFQDLYKALRREMEWLISRHQWPHAPCGLEQLLGQRDPAEEQ